ncbi:MAG: 30S ribosome-binding factor RbfA [Patescibacteria group bacterium]|jgi:ribosome-binding factor A
MPSKRVNQLNALLQQKLGELFLTEINFAAGTLVSITRVETTGDIRHCSVFLSVMPEEYGNGVLNLLQKRLPFLQHELMKRLTLARIPSLHFRLDIRGQNAAHMEALLDEVKKTLPPEEEVQPEK